MLNGHCIITGGAGAMGAATARLAAKSGYAVTILSLEAEQARAEGLISEIKTLNGRVQFIPTDVSCEDDVIASYASAVDAFGAPNAAFHAAGMFVGNHVRDLDFQSITKLVSVNVIGLMICCREATRHMSTKSGGVGGSIVNVSSMAATIGGRPGHSVYAASKGAVDVFTKGFAKEVAREGIRVNTIRPGAVTSPMTAALDTNPELKKSVEESIPMGRIGDPQEIARIALWLMSPASSLVTGSHIDAGGGGFVVAGSI